MIQLRSVLNVCDNSGATLVECLHVYGGSKRRYGNLGDKIVVRVRSARPDGTVKVKSVQRAVIVRTRGWFKRDADDTMISFNENSCVLVDKKGMPIGTRLFGPIPLEIKLRGYQDVSSLAKEVI